MKKSTHTAILCEKCKSVNKSLIRFCSVSELESVNYSKTCITYKRGEALFQEGAMPLGMFCISSGSIKIVKEASGGKEQIIRIAGTGDSIGYRSLIMHQRYSTSAIATEDSKVCLIPREEFTKISANNNQFYEAIMLLLCEEIENSQNKMAEIAYKPVRGRVAEALILLAQMANPQGIINLTREDLASFVGTVKETVIRTLSEFKGEHLIEIDKRCIKVLNINGLESVSGLYD
ncbi:MAG: Crp/Fnr family transcriptional regulator [Bacteroidetes bacterium]|nr:MAG: Crp/Fnr family transcriptional regulator [Bacteroidota bacterium]